VVVDADELVKCCLCGAEAFIFAEMTAGKPVPLCSDCFARVEPEVMRAAAGRQPSDGPPLRLVRKAGSDGR
jgi:hypothetical protein